ncbi:hypothetical protein V6N13_088604 [Hibiscus sabdariffa]|uniref:DC1 domain-containing protein n=1 Tax=Hibiscus sabdariffa TaxID=183260 RepID=A0ABR2FZU6_9ROSI
MDNKLSSKCDHYRYLEMLEERCCDECGGKISDPAFACEGCNVCLHKSCALKKRRRLSHEIMHPLHLQHQLQLLWSNDDFICDKCLYISSGYAYKCSPCGFGLDLACASSTNDELPNQESLRFEGGKKKTIQHYSHSHKLSFFKYRKIHEEDYDCFWCEKHLLGVCYGCLLCKFFLHPVCSDKMPRTLPSFSSWAPSSLKLQRCGL